MEDVGKLTPGQYRTFIQSASDIIELIYGEDEKQRRKRNPKFMQNVGRSTHAARKAGLI